MAVTASLVQAGHVDLRGEFSRAELGDVRLNARAAVIAESAVRRPETSIPLFTGGSSGAEALYRFVNNDSVEVDELVSSHAQATVERSAGVGAGSCVLVVHDSTTFGYGKDTKRKGLGQTAAGGMGFMTHVSLCIAEHSRVPFGVIASRSWVRPSPYGDEDTLARRRPAAQQKQKPESGGPEDPEAPNESRRWHEQALSAGAQLEGIEHVHVADRESDGFKYLANLELAGARFVTRVQHDRKVGPREKLYGTMNTWSIRCTRTVSISRRGESTSPGARKSYPAREGREASLEISAGVAEITRAQRQPANLPKKLRLNYVLVHEVNVPDGLEPVVWRLVTNLPIDTPEQVERIVDIYCARWTVEEYFKALKTGCSFNEHQLESYAALNRLLSVLLVSAWKLLEFKTIARTQPEAPAEVVLTSRQITILRALHDRQHPRAKLPALLTVKDAMFAVAALGGHFKQNGDPGWQLLGRGMRRLWEAEQDFETLTAMNATTNGAQTTN